jgi:uncharacterized membrane protein YcaP (DUF421 family)
LNTAWSSALGNGLATVVLTESINWAQATVGFLALMLTQLALLWLSTRSAWFQTLLQGRPVLVFYEGRFLEKVMSAYGVSQEHILTTMRRRKILRPESVWAVVFENDGKLSLLPHPPKGKPEIMEGVDNFPPHEDP